MFRRTWLLIAIPFGLLTLACSEAGGGPGETSAGEPVDPSSATEVVIDRFSEEAGTLMVRNQENGLPEPGEPIDFDQGPFITQGFGPKGQTVKYYNFDVQPTETAPIYALFRKGEDSPVEGQLNIVGVVPGDDGYSDFWQVQKVTVPEDYEANSVTSVEELFSLGYAIESTDRIVNCPVVPYGSTAELRFDDADSDLVQGWYEDQLVYYFHFAEKALKSSQAGESERVPSSPIFVSFNVNPDDSDPMSGPPSGFVTEEDSPQTHNVVATVPEDDAYSPLWLVSVYDNTDFEAVKDLSTVQEANLLASGVAAVNCPVVEQGD